MHFTQIVPLMIGLTLAINICYYLWIRRAYRRQIDAGTAELERGNHRSAELHFRRALAVANRSSRPPQDWIASCYIELAQVYARTQRQEDALRLALAAIDCTPKPYGGVKEQLHRSFEV